MRTVALIPTYQPADELLTTIGELVGEGIEVVVVDDGSGSAYRSVLDRARGRADVIGYERNRGKGHALKYGLGHVAGRYAGDTVIVTVDGDGQHDAHDALRCAREAAAHPGTLVLGRRDFDGRSVPWRSRVGNRATRALFRLTSGVAVGDTQAGLRAFCCSMAGQLLNVPGERYEWETNVLLACPEANVEIRELPVKTIYRDGNAGSHFRVVRDSLRVWGSILAFCASSLASFCLDYLLFALLVGWLGAVAANVFARLVSAGANFAINRALVFRSRASAARSAARYAVVAAVLLAAGTLAVSLLVDVMGANALIAKPVAELALFALSWTLQSRFVFRRGAGPGVHVASQLA